MAQSGQLSVRTKLAYGVGQVAEGIKNVAFVAFLVVYYNQALGLDPALAALAAGLALGFDAVSDPLAGALSDAYRSRWGRRHPFMLASAIPLGVTFYLLFSPPAGLEGWSLFGWLLATAVAVRAAMTFYHVPHLALGADLSDDYVERTKIYTYGTIFGFIAGIGMRVGTLVVFLSSAKGGVSNPDNYGPFAMFFGVVMAASILLCVWGTRDRIPYLKANEREATPFSFGAMFGGLRALLGYHAFRTLFFGSLLTTTIYGIETFMQTYTGLYFWGLPEEMLGKLAGSLLLGVPLAFFVVPWMTRRLDKRNALIATVVILVLSTNIPIIARLLGVFPENDSALFFPILFLFYVVAGMIAPALYIIPASMFADIADEVALHTGERKEGLILAARSFVNKVALGVGTILGGLLLKVIAFPQGAVAGEIDPEIVFKLGVAQGPLTSFFTLVGLFIIMRYSLDAKRHAEIRAQLAAKQAGAAAAATDDLPMPTPQGQPPLATVDN